MDKLLLLPPPPLENSLLSHRHLENKKKEIEKEREKLICVVCVSLVFSFWTSAPPCVADNEIERRTACESEGKKKTDIDK